jgi:hypothetical protein
MCGTGSLFRIFGYQRSFEFQFLNLDTRTKKTAGGVGLGFSLKPTSGTHISLLQVSSCVVLCCGTVRTPESGLRSPDSGVCTEIPKLRKNLT